MTIIFTNTIKLWKMNKILKVKKKKVGWWLLGALSPSFTLWFTLGCSVFFITMYINILNWVYQVALLSATLGVFFYLIHVEMRIWTTRQKFCEAVLYVCLIRFNSYVQAFFFLFFFFWERSANPLQYSCLQNPTDGGAWWATVHGVIRVGYGWSDSALALRLF